MTYHKSISLLLMPLLFSSPITSRSADAAVLTYLADNSFVSAAVSLNGSTDLAPTLFSTGGPYSTSTTASLVDGGSNLSATSSIDISPTETASGDGIISSFGGFSGGGSALSPSTGSIAGQTVLDLTFSLSSSVQFDIHSEVFAPSFDPQSNTSVTLSSTTGTVFFSEAKLGQSSQISNFSSVIPAGTYQLVASTFIDYATNNSQFGTGAPRYDLTASFAAIPDGTVIPIGTTTLDADLRGTVSWEAAGDEFGEYYQEWMHGNYSASADYFVGSGYDENMGEWFSWSHKNFFQFDFSNSSCEDCWVADATLTIEEGVGDDSLTYHLQSVESDPTSSDAYGFYNSFGVDNYGSGSIDGSTDGGTLQITLNSFGLADLNAAILLDEDFMIGGEIFGGSALSGTQDVLSQLEITTVANTAPTADLYVSSIDLGEGATLDASGTIDLETAYGDTSTFSWDVNDDSVQDFSTTTPVLSLTSSELASFGINSNGAYQISVSVTDTWGADDFVIRSLVVGSDPIEEPVEPGTSVSEIIPGQGGAADDPGGITATFDEVTTAGNLSGDFSEVAASEIASVLDAVETGASNINFNLATDPVQLWEIDFNGEFVNLVELTFGYDDSALLLGQIEDSLQVHHFVDGQWEVAQKTDQDLTANTITILTDSLSPFMLGGIVTTPGDFDGDGDVDGDDLTDPVFGWEARFGIDLDGSDFLDWQANLGTGTLAAATIPEPTTSALALAALCLAMSRRRAR